MATSRNSERVRFRYGMCLNDNCSKCKSKEIQEISARKDLVCTECGKPLRECPPPKKSSHLGLITGIVVVVVVLAIGAYLLFFRTAPEKEEANEPTPEAVQDNVGLVADTLSVDTLQRDSTNNNVIPDAEENTPSSVEPQREETRTNSTPRSSSAQSTTPTVGNNASNGSLNLGYGTYSGEISGGQPHGQGKLVYSRQAIISKYDPKARTAEVGEYVQGQFVNGYPTIVRHYDANGHLIETLNLGVD